MKGDGKSVLSYGARAILSHTPEFKGFKAEDGTVRGVRKPANWQRAVDLASEVLVSEMRTLLETG